MTAEHANQDNSASEPQDEAAKVDASLVEAIERDARRRLRWERIMFAALAVAGVWLIVDILSGWLGVGFWGRKNGVRVGDWFQLLIVAISVPFYRRMILCRLRLARLARDEAPTALDSLLDANEHFPTENRSERLKLLCSLLSRVREGDEGRLTGRRVRATALIAASGRYPHDVRMAALSALRYVADEQAASRVAAIANTPVLTLNGEALCRAARLYLPEIRARLNKRRETGHLLRPAEPPPESTLLRPIEAAPKGDERLLVRPVEDDPRRDIEVRGDARM